MRRILSFKSVTLIHFRYWVVQLWSLAEVAKEYGFLEAWFHQARRRESTGVQGGLWKVVLESWYYTRRVVQRYSKSFKAQFQGIPNWVQLDPPIP